MVAGDPARPSSTRPSRRRKRLEKRVMRGILVALATLLVTFGAFSTTVAAIIAAGPVTVQIA